MRSLDVICPSRFKCWRLSPQSRHVRDRGALSVWFMREPLAWLLFKGLSTGTWHESLSQEWTRSLSLPHKTDRDPTVSLSHPPVIHIHVEARGERWRLPLPRSTLALEIGSFTELRAHRFSQTSGSQPVGCNLFGG